jgi:hypothetical protein
VVVGDFNNPLSPIDRSSKHKINKEILGEDVGKKDPLYTAGGNASWWNHSGKKFGGFLKI